MIQCTTCFIFLIQMQSLDYKSSVSWNQILRGQWGGDLYVQTMFLRVQGPSTWILTVRFLCLWGPVTSDSSGIHAWLAAHCQNNLGGGVHGYIAERLTLDLKCVNSCKVLVLSDAVSSCLFEMLWRAVTRSNGFQLQLAQLCSLPAAVCTRGILHRETSCWKSAIVLVWVISHFLPVKYEDLIFSASVCVCYPLCLFHPFTVCSLQSETAGSNQSMTPGGSTGWTGQRRSTR